MTIISVRYQIYGLCDDKKYSWKWVLVWLNFIWYDDKYSWLMCWVLVVWPVMSTFNMSRRMSTCCNNRNEYFLSFEPWVLVIITEKNGLPSGMITSTHDSCDEYLLYDQSWVLLICTEEWVLFVITEMSTFCPLSHEYLLSCQMEKLFFWTDKFQSNACSWNLS